MSEVDEAWERFKILGFLYKGKEFLEKEEFEDFFKAGYEMGFYPFKGIKESQS